MKGKTMVIGLVAFVLIAVSAIYFAMTATIKNVENENGMEQVISIVEIPDLFIGNSYLNYYEHA